MNNKNDVLIKHELMAAHNMIPTNTKETDYGFNRNSFHSHLKLNEF